MRYFQKTRRRRSESSSEGEYIDYDSSESDSGSGSESEVSRPAAPFLLQNSSHLFAATQGNGQRKAKSKIIEGKVTSPFSFSSFLLLQEYSSDEEESNINKVAYRWKAKGMKRSYTKAEQRRNTNISSLFLLSPGDNSLQSLARDLLHQALHICSTLDENHHILRQNRQ